LSYISLLCLQYEAAGAAWRDAYKTFQKLRDDASLSNTTQAVVRDFESLGQRESQLSQELDEVHKALALTLKEAMQDREQQDAIRSKYQNMQDLVQNAFRPLYRGDDEAAIDAVKQVRSVHSM